MAPGLDAPERGDQTGGVTGPSDQPTRPRQPSLFDLVSCVDAPVDVHMPFSALLQHPPPFTLFCMWFSRLSSQRLIALGMQDKKKKKMV